MNNTRKIWLLTLSSVLAFTGCTLSSNSVYAPTAPAPKPTLADGTTVQAQADNNPIRSGRTIININSTQNAAPTNPLVVQTGYQTVYTTEYGPMGPMVKKAMIPVYSAAPGAMPNAAPVAPANLLPAPGLTGEPNGAPIIFQQNIMPQPNYPVAQPVVPAVPEPSAWFGPASSPNAYYSQQTKWY